MTSHTRPSRVAEWAELVGDSVPDVVREGEEPADRSRSAAERAGDAIGRWAGSDGSANGQ